MSTVSGDRCTTSNIRLLSGWVVFMAAMPVFSFDGFFLLGPRSSFADTDQVTRTIVQIRTREFSPNPVFLRTGHKTTLVLENHDSELHAFVPIDFLTGLNLNISGNGAPEFGPQGFKRVIIPPDGYAEIQFTPEHPGEFHYFCDMPGHEMRAAIIVVE
ncbi:MAG: cupredoxin domain-containing protein [Nitrospiraceae bacterium]